MIKVAKIGIDVAVDTAAADRDFNRWARDKSRTKIKVGIDLDTTRADEQVRRFRERAGRNVRVTAGLHLGNTLPFRARVAALTRPRFLTVIPRLGLTGLAGLVLPKSVTDGLQSLMKLLIPSNLLAGFGGLIAMSGRLFVTLGSLLIRLGMAAIQFAAMGAVIVVVAAAVAAFVAVLVVAVPVLVGFGIALGHIASLSLTLPGILAGLVLPFLTVKAAMKDAQEQLGELTPDLKRFQRLISLAFWHEARGPILDLVRTLLPPLQKGLTVTARLMGQLAAAISRDLKAALGNGTLQAILGNINRAIGILVGGTGSWVSSLVKLIQLGTSYLPALATWFNRIGVNFHAWLTDGAQGRFQRWIHDGIGQLKALWDIGRGIIDVFRAMDAAAGGTGGVLRTIAGLLQRLAAWIRTPDFIAGWRTLYGVSVAYLKAIGGVIKAVIGFFKEMAPVIKSAFSSVWGTVAAIITAIGRAFSGSSEFKRGISELFSGFAAGVRALQPALGPLASILGAIASLFGAAFRTAGPLIAGLVRAFAPLIIQVAGLAQRLLPPLASVIQVVGSALSSSLQPVFATLFSVLQQLLPVLGPVFTSVIRSLAPLLGSVIKLAGTLVATILPVLAQVIAALAPVIKMVVDAVTPLIPQLGTLLAGAIKTLAPVVMTLVRALLPILPLVVQIGSRLIAGLMPAVMSVVTAIAPLVSQLLSQLAPVLQRLAPLVVALVGKLVSGLLPVIVQLLPVIWKLALTLISQLAPIFVQLVPLLIPIVQQLANGLAKVLPKLIPLFIQLVKAVVPLLPPLLQLVARLLPPLFDLMVALAPVMVPVISLLGQLLTDVVVPLLGPLGDIVTSLLPVLTSLFVGIAPIITAVVTALSPLVTALGYVAYYLGQVLSMAGQLVGGALQGIVTALTGGDPTAVMNRTQTRVTQQATRVFTTPPPIPGFAEGGKIKPGSRAWVGENGPELVDVMRDGSLVHPYDVAKRYVAQAGAGRQLPPQGPLSATSGASAAASLVVQQLTVHQEFKPENMKDWEAMVEVANLVKTGIRQKRQQGVNLSPWGGPGK